MPATKFITPNQFKKRLDDAYAGYIVVGITGHRDLLNAGKHKKQIKEAVREKLIKLADGRPILLISGLAYGADQWVVAAARKVPQADIPAIALCIPLTMTPYDYIESSFLKEEKPNKDTGKIDKIYFDSGRSYYEKNLRDEEPIQVKLYPDSLYAGRERLTNRERDEQYEELGKFMARFCDHLIALWDGVDGGGIGGTSDVVRMMVQGKSLLGGPIPQKETPQHLHQYVVPRQKNSFPIGRRFAKADANWPVAPVYSWVDTPIENRHENGWRNVRQRLGTLPFWYRIIGIAVLVLTAIDIHKTWLMGLSVTEATWQNIRQDAGTWGIVSSLYLLAGLSYLRFVRGRNVLLQFVIPIVLAISVLVLGTIGFYATPLGDLDPVDSFFGAANLITLNTSVFSVLGSPEQPILMNIWLKTARILGGFLAGYGFILAFTLATGRENVGQLRFWLYRLFNGSFSVVLGSGAMAVNLATDLVQNKKQRVVLLTDPIDTTLLNRLSDYQVWLFQGQITDRTAIGKTYFWKADSVYVVDDSDDNNFRCAQELDELYVLKNRLSWVRQCLLTDSLHWLFCRLPARWQEFIHEKPKPNWHVHQQHERQRALLQSITRLRLHLHTFSINGNTTRRLLLRYPIDRFQGSQATIAEVAILGFDQQAHDLALTCLRLGHYTPGKHLHLTIYYRPDEKDTVDAFRQQHPELFKNRDTEGVFSRNSGPQAVQKYTFFTRKRPAPRPTRQLTTELSDWLQDDDWPVVEFEPLPTAETELISPDFSLYNLIQPDRVVSVYICQPTGLESAALLGSILPRIEWLKQGKPGGEHPVDVQVFCYYNFPDLDEEQYVEMRLNAVAPYLPVVCFGNLINECVADAIHNESLNQIARQIAFFYVCLYGGTVVQEIPGLEAWLKEIDDEVVKLKEKGKLDEKEEELEGNKLYIAKTNVLLPAWAKQKKDRPDVFANWLTICWENLEEIDRESNIQAADHAWVKLRLLDQAWDKLLLNTEFTVDQLNALSEVEHRRWNAEHLLAGWLPQPDTDLWKSHKKALRPQKLHHFLKPFDGPGGLPEVEQNKDYTQVLALPYFFDGLTGGMNS